jgi:hypothetical protein
MVTNKKKKPGSFYVPQESLNTTAEDAPNLPRWSKSIKERRGNTEE